MTGIAPRTTLMLAGGLTGLVALSISLVIWPAHTEARQVEADILAKRAELSQAGKQPEAIEKLATELAALRRFGEQRMTPIPEDSGVADLVRNLSSTFDELGLKDREVTTGAPKQLDEASALPMSVMVSGSFPKVYAAVCQIERLPRLLRTQRLRIAAEKAPVGSLDRSGRVRADLQLDVFYAPRAVAGDSAKEGPTP